MKEKNKKGFRIFEFENLSDTEIFFWKSKI